MDVDTFPTTQQGLVMKNLVSMALLAAVALSSGSVSQSAFANDADTAAKNARRAENQDFKADRAAARGEGYKAEKHAEDAARDEHKVRKEEHRAIRKGEGF
jgi:hypothetical protein